MAYVFADMAAAEEGGPWRGIFVLLYALFFRSAINPFVDGWRERWKK